MHVTTQPLRAVPDAPEHWRAEPGGQDEGLTVEQLAAQTGLTVRNIRAHQSRGLLPPPEVRGRVGYYGPEHVARLRLVREMQADGYNLNAIKKLLEGSQGDAEQLLGLRRLLTEPFESEQPEIVTAEELEERFGVASAKEIARAEKLGVLVPLGKQRWEAPSPSLLRAAEEVIRRGASLESVLSVTDSLKRHSEAVARRFVKLFLDDVWHPFDEAGQPEGRWPEIVESIERLRPLASEALLAVFKQAMTREVEEAFGKELERVARKAG